MEKDCWFRDWFDSPYYHLLYNKRDDHEAQHFIDNLCAYLKLPSLAKIWDVPCGKGRHANAFARKGYQVTGTDLSSNSIYEAIKNKEPNSEFFVHDMLEEFRKNEFDCAVNLFTSIGYFDSYNDNFIVFKNIHQALKDEGILVIDFFNAEKVKQFNNKEYTEQRGEITFHISKKIVDRRILKKINFEHHGKKYAFEETVSLFDKEDFEKFASHTGFRLVDTFGDYNLNPFMQADSDRLILIFRK